VTETRGDSDATWVVVDVTVTSSVVESSSHWPAVDTDSRWASSFRRRHSPRPRMWAVAAAVTSHEHARSSYRTNTSIYVSPSFPLLDVFVSNS